MPRYEYQDDKSHKFWQITVEGQSFTVQYGRVGTRGQASTKSFDSAEKAERKAKKLTASKLEKGYVEVGAEVEDALSLPKNPELEGAIAKDPNDESTWQVYGDWPQQQDDARGELVALEIALAAAGGNDSKLEARRDALLAEHTPRWLGADLTKAYRYRAIVVRSSRHPITNLHLGGQRGDLGRLRERISDEAWAQAMASCEAVAKLHGAFHLGIDLALSRSWSQHHVLEANAFGDLLPGPIADGGTSVYELEVELAAEWM